MRHVVPRNENLFEFRLNAKHSMRLDEHEVFVKEVLDEGSMRRINADTNLCWSFDGISVKYGPVN